MQDHYAILGVPHKATTEEIITSFRKKALLYHPDKALSKCKNKTESEKEEIKTLYSNKFERIQLAYNVLSDPILRTKYNQDFTDTYLNYDKMKNIYTINSDGLSEELQQIKQHFTTESFNTEFDKKRKGQITETYDSNVLSDYTKKLAERDDPLCEIPKLYTNKTFSIDSFNNLFDNKNNHAINNDANNVINTDMAEYQASNIFDYKNDLAEWDPNGTVDHIDLFNSLSIGNIITGDVINTQDIDLKQYEWKEQTQYVKGNIQAAKISDLNSLIDKYNNTSYNVEFDANVLTQMKEDYYHNNHDDERIK